jgi:hypothetical protein
MSKPGWKFCVEVLFNEFIHLAKVFFSENYSEFNPENSCKVLYFNLTLNRLMRIKDLSE